MKWIPCLCCWRHEKLASVAVTDGIKDSVTKDMWNFTAVILGLKIFAAEDLIEKFLQ